MSQSDAEASYVLDKYTDFLTENQAGFAVALDKNYSEAEIPGLVVDSLLPLHDNRSLALACSLSDYFHTEFSGNMGRISLHIKCAQEAMKQHEPAVVIWQAISAIYDLGSKKPSESKERTKERETIIRLLRDIHHKEGNIFGSAAFTELRAIDPSPEDRTATSDRRITGETGVRDYFPHDR